MSMSLSEVYRSKIVIHMNRFAGRRKVGEEGWGKTEGGDSGKEGGNMTGRGWKRM